MLRLLLWAHLPVVLLLAYFTATIEAARVGEVGKGFAVVAGEVKEQAGQTATAIAKIEATIAEGVRPVAVACLAPSAARP